MKRVVIIFALFIAVIAGIIIYTSHIPDITVTYNNVKIEVLKCPFGWSSFMRSFRADYATPDELAGRVNSAVVKPQSHLDVKFSRMPNDIKVYLWNEKSEIYNYDHGKIIIPKEKGIYVFQVLAEWTQGEVSYIFKADVR